MPRTFEDDLISDAQIGFVSDFAKVVEYRSGNLVNAELEAVPVKPERLVDLETTAPNETTDLDWLVVVSELTLDDEPHTPRSGDRMTAPFGGVEMIFEVTPRDNLPHHEWADAFQTMFRIRTKRVRNG